MTLFLLFAALHFTNKLGLLKISGSAGVNVSQYLLNGELSNVVPTTSLTIDFDDTLALKKRISNNAKIRFESTFDVGQQIGASVLEQDLVSYTYISARLKCSLQPQSQIWYWGWYFLFLQILSIRKYQFG